MRTIALVILLCVSSEVVSAQTNEQCQPTQRAADLLACYNGTAPRPHTLGKPATSKASTARDKPASRAPTALERSVASKTPTDQKDQYVDFLTVENARLDTRLKTICRGC
jgi:hypothetical protein